MNVRVTTEYLCYYLHTCMYIFVFLFTDGTHTPSLTVDQCKQVLECINRVLYVKLGFHGNTQDYYNEINSNINQVRREGVRFQD